MATLQHQITSPPSSPAKRKRSLSASSPAHPLTTNPASSRLIIETATTITTDYSPAPAEAPTSTPPLAAPPAADDAPPSTPTTGQEPNPDITNSPRSNVAKQLQSLRLQQQHLPQPQYFEQSSSQAAQDASDTQPPKQPKRARLTPAHGTEAPDSKLTTSSSSSSSTQLQKCALSTTIWAEPAAFSSKTSSSPSTKDPTSPNDLATNALPSRSPSPYALSPPKATAKQPSRCPSQSRSRSPSPPPSSLTWQDEDITGHLALDPDDDGTGLNGVGFRPNAAVAWRRKEGRRRQLEEWRRREGREARRVRGERRRRLPPKDAAKGPESATGANLTSGFAGSEGKEGLDFGFSAAAAAGAAAERKTVRFAS